MKRLLALSIALLTLLLSGYSWKSGRTEKGPASLEAHTTVQTVARRSDAPSADAPTGGRVHVTFAQNANLQLAYYSDAERTKRISGSDYYLVPGGSIYAEVKAANSKYSSNYHFDKLLILQFGGPDGPTELQDDLVDYTGKDGPVITIPANFSGSELSIMPCGKYEDRTLQLCDYYLGENGEMLPLPGTWSIDGENGAKTNGDALTVDPFALYTVVYDYSDFDDFYFVSSSPACLYYTDGDDSGAAARAVYFRTEEGRVRNENFYVQLRPYTELEISNKAQKTIQIFTPAFSIPALVNGGAIEQIEINETGKKDLDEVTNELKKLKWGDSVSLWVSSGFQVNGYGAGLSLSGPIPADGGKKQIYTVRILEGAGQSLRVTVSERADQSGDFEPRTTENGDVLVLDAAEYHLQPGDSVPPGDEVTVLITPNTGYYVDGTAPNESAYRSTMTYSEYLKQIDSILSSHPIKPYIHVTLQTEGEHGTFRYTVNGEERSGETDLREGQVLKIKYTLTDADYELSAKKSRWQIFGGGDDGTEHEITVGPELDGTTYCGEEPVEPKEKAGEADENG